MKKTIIIIIAIILVIAFGWVSIYNRLASSLEFINQKQSEIDNQLKRRADLIPNLVNAVKGLTKQEQSVVDSVTSARTKMTTGTTQSRLNASSELSTAINVMVENYPVLKSDTAFVSLMDELAGTENRITVARKAFNDGVGKYNASIKTYPTKIIAGVSGFNATEYLEVEEQDKTTPTVEFE